MNKRFTLFLLLLLVIGILSQIKAQKALDPNQFVNTQITGPGVYTVQAGQAYAFDGRIDLTFDVTIIGPDATWIYKQEKPPVMVNTPAADGTARTFFEIKDGGSLTVKNILFSGSNNNNEITGNFIANTGGSKMIADNCVFTDWRDFALRNQFKGDSTSITNCVFINGVRPLYNPFGGFPLRMDVSCNNTVIENNTVVNSGRLTGNSGPWGNARVHELHNTYLNQTVNGHEQRAFEMITANNIFYNYHFIGRRNEKAVNPSNTYDAYFTTWNYFADSKATLDSISLYLGQNLFYREPKITSWFETNGGDTLSPSLLWEHPDVDSFIIADNDYTIGTNYSEIDPIFKTHPGNTDNIVKFMAGFWAAATDFADWRITPPVSFNTDGFPVLAWPPAFELSYSNTDLQSAGTDGLPVGDLNWFPTKKADYIARRGEIISAIRDSMKNAVAVYDPNTMDSTPLITNIINTSVEQIELSKLAATGNFPNPFTGSTTITYSLNQPSKVRLRVFNITGQQVYESSETEQASGNHEFVFDAAGLGAGTYIYKINAIGRNGQNYVAAQTMIITK